MERGGTQPYNCESVSYVYHRKALEGIEGALDAREKARAAAGGMW